MNRLITLTLAIVATATVAARPSAAQESYPNKPITMITPEVVGSAADVLSRVIARLLADAYGQPVTIENIYLEAGVEKAIKSPPDGYTLMYGSSGNMALLPHVKKVAFDPTKDLTPVARFVLQPTLIAVNPSLPVNTLQELVALMKEKPGTLKMSTAGAGTAGHFAGEMLIAMAGVKPIVAHYNGGGPAIDATFGGLYCAALDSKGERVYLADLDNRRIRMVDLKSGQEVADKETQISITDLRKRVAQLGKGPAK